MVSVRTGRYWVLVCMSLWLGAAAAAARDGVFRLSDLPRGKNVTIPRPATTHVPLMSRVRFTGTDIPQALSFRVMSGANSVPGKLRLSIYDPNSDRVKYVDINPGTPFVYNLKNLEPITVIPTAHGVGAGLVLQVESNKPLDIAH